MRTKRISDCLIERVGFETSALKIGITTIHCGKWIRTVPLSLLMSASTADLAVEGLPGGQSGVETEKGSEVKGTNMKPEIKYPHGLAFFMLTVGLMAVVLILALDNYIIGLSSEFCELLGTD